MSGVSLDDFESKKTDSFRGVGIGIEKTISVRGVAESHNTNGLGLRFKPY
jgi:hypothetical protein